MDDDGDYDFDALDRLEATVLAQRQCSTAQQHHPQGQPQQPPAPSYGRYQNHQGAHFHLPGAVQQVQAVAPWGHAPAPPSAQHWQQQPQPPAPMHYAAPLNNTYVPQYNTGQHWGNQQHQRASQAYYAPPPPVYPQRHAAAAPPPVPQPQPYQPYQPYPQAPQKQQKQYNGSSAWQQPRPSMWQQQPQLPPLQQPQKHYQRPQQPSNNYQQQQQNQWQQPQAQLQQQQPQAQSPSKDKKQRNLFSTWGISKQAAQPSNRQESSVMPHNNAGQTHQKPTSHPPPALPLITPLKKTFREIQAHPYEVEEDLVREEEEEINGDALVECPTTTGGILLRPSAARHWVYPSGVPEREYQMTAISAALLTNALVCLPTGLGKTLIAAVVMHNFARWFPQGKVVFVAPTRPLVSQQIEACQRFMGLERSTFAEMTGRIKGEERKDVWQSDTVRVYFCTPQTFWNDVKKGICPYDAVTCVVLDECHRVTGQADAAQALRFMRDKCRLKFRTLGLSATPGSSADQVQEVITTLGIGALVFRSEADPDVAPYVHRKTTDVLIVDAELEDGGLRAPLIASLQRLVGHLAAARVYFGPADADRVTRYGLLQAQRGSRDAANTGAAGRPSAAAADWFRQASLLADLRDQLDSYGVHAALGYLKGKMAEERSLRSLHAKDPVFCHFAGSLERAAAAGGSNARVCKLLEVLQAHFRAVPPDSQEHPGRVIVFTNLRDGVAAIIEALRMHEPLIKARAFVGQGGAASGPGAKSSGPGMKQKEQKEVLAGFAAGTFNVLVATCIGEEGLDIPAVDLIVCFDATASPTRAVQRQGRTGRHREGRVVYILSAGREEERFRSIEETTNRLHSQLRNPDQCFALHQSCPRMLPRRFNPQKLAVEVGKPDAVMEQEVVAGDNVGAARRGRGRGRGRGQARGGGRGRGRRGAADVDPLAAIEEEQLDTEMLPEEKVQPTGNGNYRRRVPALGPLQKGLQRAAELAAAAAAAARPLLFPSSSSFVVQIPNRKCPAVTPPPTSLATFGSKKASSNHGAAAADKPPSIDTPPPSQRRMVPEVLEDGAAVMLPNGRILRHDDEILHPWAFLAAAIARSPPPAPPPAVAAAGAAAKKRKKAAATAAAKKRRAEEHQVAEHALAQQAQALEARIGEAAGLVAQGGTRVQGPAIAVAQASPVSSREQSPAAQEQRDSHIIDLAMDSSDDDDQVLDDGDRVLEAPPWEDFNPSMSQQPLALRKQQLVGCEEQPASHNAPAPEEDVPLSTRMAMLRTTDPQNGVPAALQPQQLPQQPSSGAVPANIPSNNNILANNTSAPEQGFDHQAPHDSAFDHGDDGGGCEYGDGISAFYDEDDGIYDYDAIIDGADDGGGGVGDSGRWEDWGQEEGVSVGNRDGDDDGVDAGAGIRESHDQLAASKGEPNPSQEVLAWKPRNGRSAAVRRRVIILDSQSQGDSEQGDRDPPAAAPSPSVMSLSLQDLTGGSGQDRNAAGPRAAEPPPPANLTRLRKAGQISAPAPAPKRPAPQTAPPRRQPIARPPKAARRKLAGSRFIDQEAQLSGDESGDDDEDDLDGFLSDFIDDGTQTQGTEDASPATGGDRFSSLPAFHHGRFLDDLASPSPGALLRKLQRARLGRRSQTTQPSGPKQGGAGSHPGIVTGTNVLDTPGFSSGGYANNGIGNGLALVPGASLDDYDTNDPFIDDGDQGGGAWDTPVGKLTSDDACSMCGAADGELLCCDGCPCVYHLACCGLSQVPDGDWLCAVCRDGGTPAGRRR